jgi:glyoxylase-like metal-dependent hydrolase (beta-lactamase superfamily II)
MTQEETSDIQNGLEYPFSIGPLPGEVIEICDGVYWSRMPLGMDLKWINIWIIRDEGGWAIVDTGVNTSATLEAWEKILTGFLGGEPITRVIGTHMHPDHIGMAGWLTEKFDIRLWMTRLEYVTCRMLVNDPPLKPPKEGLDFYTKAGWGEEALENYKKRFGGFGKMVYPLPDAYKRIQDGDNLKIGDYVWQVVVGNGHSPEHACLLCEELGLLISGDQILPKISSNVSVFPTEPDANPLMDWITSCQSLIEKVPANVLVLPSHNKPFYGAHTRLSALIAKHEKTLQRLLDLVTREPVIAVECFGALFKRTIGGGSISLATGETIAHLNYLWHDGRIKRKLEGQVYKYSIE